MSIILNQVETLCRPNARRAYRCPVNGIEGLKVAIGLKSRRQRPNAPPPCSAVTRNQRLTILVVVVRHLSPAAQPGVSAPALRFRITAPRPAGFFALPHSLSAGRIRGGLPAF